MQVNTAHSGLMNYAFAVDFTLKTWLRHPLQFSYQLIAK